MIKMLDFPVIDMHTHLRDEIGRHTRMAGNYGVDVVVYMANCDPPLDNLEAIKQSLAKTRYCQAIPVSAITKGLEGKELVDIDEIKPWVAGFSDDGKLLQNLDLLNIVLKKNVLVLAHCSPPFETGWVEPGLETKWVKMHLDVLAKTGGLLHIQHVSKKGTVEVIRKAKKQGTKVTCETCPHYWTFSRQDLDTKVNPPLGEEEDVCAVRQGLADGTIDVIASDYAPEPRITGMAGRRAFLPLSYGLVLEGILTEEQLKEKLFLNPKRIIESGGYKLKGG